MARPRILVLALIANLLPHALTAAEVTLARGGATPYQLYLPEPADEVTTFAAAELRKYFTQITGADLPRATEPPVTNIIVIGLSAARSLGEDPTDTSTHADAFLKLVTEDRIVLAGNTPRATLYAVYAFLEDLGCRWLAPNFDYPGIGAGDHVPSTATLTIRTGRAVETPSFRYRYKRVEEGHSHNLERLIQLADWMAKARMNALNCPIDYNNRGRSAWDKWRDALTPELRKRGITVDVGGHGYENFLPPEKYAADHPDWYGTLNGKLMADMKRVNFNTANQDAVETLIANLEQFLRDRPEIEIFSLVPPDTPNWDESPASRRLGSIPDRHALLVNQVAVALAKEFPDLRLVIPAYQALIRPPDTVPLEGDLILGFAAIRRDNSRPMSDLSNNKNAYYNNYLWQWLDSPSFGRDIIFNGYYYRYAWRSLPVVNYTVMARDLRFLYTAGVDGGESYSEPGNWFTYELMHYLLAKLLWNRHASTEAVIADYCRARYGPAAEPMQDLYALLDGISPHVVRGFGLYSDLKSPTPFPELGVQRIIQQPFAAYRRQISEGRKLLSVALHKASANPDIQARLRNWQLLIRYLDLELQAKYFSEILGSGSPYAPLLKRLQSVHAEMDTLLSQHAGAGLFLTEDPRTKYASQ